VNSIGSKQLSGARAQIFVIDDMEAEAPDSLFEPFIGTGMTAAAGGDCAWNPVSKHRDLGDHAKRRHNFACLSSRHDCEADANSAMRSMGILLPANNRWAAEKGGAQLDDPMASDGDVRCYRENGGRTIPQVAQ